MDKMTILYIIAGLNGLSLLTVIAASVEIIRQERWMRKHHDR